MPCLPIVSDSCDRREQVFRVGAAAPRVFNSKYLFVTEQMLCTQKHNVIIFFQYFMGLLIVSTNKICKDYSHCHCHIKCILSTS